MTMLPMDDSMTRYTLARHPRNRAIVDIRDQTTNELKFIKIRHRLANFYAMSLVDPKTFDVWAETQVKSAGTSRKPITLQGYKDPVLLKDTSIFGLEWTFEWENQKYKWVRESPIRPTLECRAVIGGSNVCVGRYLPRGVKDQYFGLITVLYNMVQVLDEQAMDLLLITSLMTILDKANDNSWKKEKSSGALFLEPNEIPTIRHGDTKNRDVGGTDSDSESSNDGKHDEQWVGRKEKFTNGQQKATTTTYVKQAPSADDKEKGPFQQSLNESSPAHDLRSHQQQVDYLGHMLSKYSGNATATLPPSFVQYTAIESSWAENSIGGRRSLKTMWHQNNHGTTIDYDSSNNYIHAGRQQVAPPSSSRRHNDPHQRIRSHRRLPSIDPHQWVPFSRQRLPPPANAPTFRNSLDLQSKPGSHQQHYRQ